MGCQQKRCVVLPAGALISGGDLPALSFPPRTAQSRPCVLTVGPWWQPESPSLCKEDSCPEEPPGPPLAVLCEVKKIWDCPCSRALLALIPHPDALVLNQPLQVVASWTAPVLS